MSLSPRDRTRFARHLLLSQLGEAGQERLLAARFAPTAGADAGALEVARSYLTRAGAQVLDSEAPEQELSLPATDTLTRMASSPALLEAARALAGALAAVDAIKRVAALPVSPTQDLPFCISSEDA